MPEVRFYNHLIHEDDLLGSLLVLFCSFLICAFCFIPTSLFAVVAIGFFAPEMIITGRYDGDKVRTSNLSIATELSVSQYHSSRQCCSRQRQFPGLFCHEFVYLGDSAVCV
jgi:hypothetical protein